MPETTVTTEDHIKQARMMLAGKKPDSDEPMDPILMVLIMMVATSVAKAYEAILEDFGVDTKTLKIAHDRIFRDTIADGMK
jgi:hypothetical protein